MKASHLFAAAVAMHDRVLRAPRLFSLNGAPSAAKREVAMNRCLSALALAASVSMLSGCYTVNSFVDAPDANPGDGVCARALTVAEMRRGVIAPRLAPQLEQLREAAAGLPPSALERLTRGDASTAQALTQLRNAAPGFELPDDIVNPAVLLCTLRAAIMEANARPWKSFISVPPGTYNLTLPNAPNGAGGRLLISNSMRIQGSGAAVTTVDGQGSSTVMLVDPAGNANVEINHLTIRNGNAQSGGGIFIDGGTVEMEDLVIRDNFGFTGGGGLVVSENATAYLRRSTLRDNLAQGAFGGAIWNVGSLWVYDSTLHGNQSNRAGAIHNNADGALNLRNVTISGNRADVDDPAGASGVGGIQQNGFAVLNNVTITGNEGTSDRAGGLYMQAGATTVLKNSIVAGNNGNGAADDCNGSLSGDSKYNLIGDSTGCTIPSFVFTFLLDVPAGLGSLQFNGGPTQTHRLLAGSAALDAAYSFPPPAIDACEALDQRGVPRPQGAGHCDMGAFEHTSAGSLEVSGFMLVDATTDTDIRPLRNDDWLVLEQLPPQLSIRAVVASATPASSVVFGYAGDPAYRTENIAPYALGGDVSGNYVPVDLTVGEQVLTATPYSGASGTGATGARRTIRFTVLKLN